MLKEISNSKIENFISQENKPVLIYVWSKWCNNCKQMTPVIEEFADENSTEIIFLKMNADENKDALTAYKILGVPTIMIFSHGLLVERKPGFRSKEKLTKLIGAIKDYSFDEAKENEIRGFFKWPGNIDKLFG